MTNQNVVVSDAKSGTGMSKIAAVSNSALLFPAVAGGPCGGSGGGYVRISRKKLLNKLESGGGRTRINSSVESMRASSPTRKSIDENEHEDQCSWIVSLFHCYELIV